MKPTIRSMPDPRRVLMGRETVGWLRFHHCQLEWCSGRYDLTMRADDSIAFAQASAYRSMREVRRAIELTMHRRRGAGNG